MFNFDLKIELIDIFFYSFFFICTRDCNTKVRNFLELTREEDNYEEKVRQFVEEANKHRKDRRGGGGGSDDKSLKKREKRKSRKAKKESKKRRKEKRGKSSKKDKDDSGDFDNMQFREALKWVFCCCCCINVNYSVGFLL